MRSITLLLAAASAVSAQTTTRSSAATPTYSEPCAHVSALVAGPQPNPQYPRVPAQLAYDCLNSVPIVDLDDDLELIDELTDYLQWQSTLDYLKNPPATYQGGPPGGVDILGGLADIRKRLANQNFTGEYQLQSEILNLLSKAHDGHLSYNPDILSVFSFSRFKGVISLSSDGVALPEIFFYDDITKAQNGERFNVSAIKQINGQDASKYLEAFANAAQGFQDVDARFNVMFPSRSFQRLHMNEANEMVRPSSIVDGRRKRWRVFTIRIPVRWTEYHLHLSEQHRDVGHLEPGRSQ